MADNFTPRAWKNKEQGGTDTLDAAALIDLEQRVHDGAVEDAIPPGGSAGQVLAKIDGTDRNTHWVTQSGGGGGTNGYANQNYEKTGTYVYVGYENVSGAWYIYRRTVASGARLYATGGSGYGTNWTGRTGLTYV